MGKFFDAADFIRVLPVTCRFSREHRSELGEIEEVSQYIGQLTVTCNYAIWLQGVSATNMRPSKIKRELVELRKSLRQLRNVMREVSAETWASLCQFAHFSKNSDFDSIASGFDGDEYAPFDPLHTGLCVLEELVSEPLDNEKPKRGARQLIGARCLAKLTLGNLNMNGIRATSYQDGVYFKVLRILFAAAMPELGEEAYRRHALSALSALKPAGNDAI